MYYHHTLSDTPRFCQVVNGKIDNSVFWYERESLEKGKVLLHVRDLDLTKDTGVRASLSGSPGDSLRRASSAWLSAAAGWASTGAYDKAWNLWSRKKRIPGAVFLTQSGKLIWISEIDQLCFQRF